MVPFADRPIAGETNPTNSLRAQTKLLRQVTNF